MRERAVQLVVQRAVGDQLADRALAVHDAAGDRAQIVRELHHVGDGAVACVNIAS